MKQKSALLIFICLISSCSENGNDARTNDNSSADISAGERWYSQSQVDIGRSVFKDNCAQCHGDNAEGTLKWMDPLPDGAYPPPPLNGTAHAWHHPLNALRRTVYFGGVRLGGTMPAFKDSLDKEDIDAVIAYFQSKWNKKIYDAWLQRGGLKGTS